MIVNNFLNLNEIAPKNLEAILEDASKVKKAFLEDIDLNDCNVGRVLLMALN